MCRETEVIIDVFSKCIASKQAILEKRKVVALVCSAMEMSDVSARLEEIAKSSATLREWTGLGKGQNEGDLQAEATKVQEDDGGKEMDQEEHIPVIPSGPISKTALLTAKDKSLEFLSKLGI